MAEDIKDENLEPESDEQIEESSDGLIPEDDEQNSTNDVEENTDSNESEEENTTTEESTVETKTAQEDVEEDTADHSVQKKQSKLQKILIITIGVLSGILVLGFILYLFGVFDPEPPKPTLTEQALVDANQTMKPEKYIFDSKDINIDRINGKLRILTKYEIIGTAEEERQKELEKNSKLSTQQINELIEKEKQEAKEKLKKEQEEVKQKALEEVKEKEMSQKEETPKESEKPYDLLKFIQVSIDKQALLNIKPDLDNLNVNISKCEDNSREYLLIGPFSSNKDLNTIFKEIYTNISQSATKKDLVRLEFNKICK